MFPAGPTRLDESVPVPGVHPRRRPAAAPGPRRGALRWAPGGGILPIRTARLRCRCADRRRNEWLPGAGARARPRVGAAAVTTGVWPGRLGIRPSRGRTEAVRALPPTATLVADH